MNICSSTILKGIFWNEMFITLGEGSDHMFQYLTEGYILEHNVHIPRIGF